MPYCSQCGVEVNEGTEKCPLCHEPIKTKGKKKKKADEEKYPVGEERIPLTNGQKRFLAWEILTFFLLTAFGVVLTINLIKEGTISWAGYPMVGIGSVWIISTLILLLFRNVILILSGIFVSLTGALVLIDIIDGSLNWFLVLGLPLVGMITVASGAVALLIRFLKDVGANLAAFILFLIGILCLGIDLLVSGYMGNVSISWSAIVMVSIYPVAFFLVYYHYRLKKRIDLKKIFHI
jgi:hypothetical protein